MQHVCLQRNVFENQSINQLFFKRHSQRGGAWLGLSSPSWLRYRCLLESDISHPSNKVKDDWRHNLPVLEYFLCMFFNSGFSVVVTGTARDDKTWRLSCLVDTPVSFQSLTLLQFKSLLHLSPTRNSQSISADPPSNPNPPSPRPPFPLQFFICDAEVVA